MNEKTWFMLRSDENVIARNAGEASGIAYSEELVKLFLSEYTHRGEWILDPFAGFGTTIAVAQDLGRVGIGVEMDSERADFANRHLTPPNKVICGDSRRLSQLHLPIFDFSITGVPYWGWHEPIGWDELNDPFSNYKTANGCYESYLRDLASIYRQVKSVMKANATLVVNVQNIKIENKPLFPLAFDVAKALSSVLFFERDLVWCMQKTDESAKIFGHHQYCLVFKNL